ncbi:MAG: hypothetical protein MGG11_06125 [Trichodesmium sp. MAG_R03]|nr:hypothetical protein [Trichodesmium sp. MAG_R03]
MKLLKLIDKIIRFCFKCLKNIFLTIYLTRKTKIFVQEHPLGCHVRIVHANSTDSQENYGQFIKYGRDYIVLRTSDGLSSTVFTRTIISCRIVPQETLQSKSDAKELKYPQINDEITAAVIRRKYDIEARFHSQIEIGKKNIKIKIPDFSFPDDEINNQDKANWNSLKEKYNYAKQIQELDNKFDRTPQIINKLKGLESRYPNSATIKRHIAYLYLLLENSQEAIKYYQNTVFISNAADDWFNLAVETRESNKKLACYSLEQFFLQKLINEEKDGWYIYTNILENLMIYPALEILCQNDREFSNEELILLLETSVYLLQAVGHQQKVENILQRLIGGESLDLLIQDIFKDIDGNISNNYDDYRNFYLEFNQTKEGILKEIELNKEKFELSEKQKEGNIDDYKKTKGYGSLTDSEGNQYTFNHKDIKDDSLIARLKQTSNSQFKQGTQIPIFFEVVDQKAVKLSLRDMLDGSENKPRESISTNILQGSNPYARAIRTLLVKQDLEQAAGFFRVAIDKKDNFEKSVECIVRVLEELGRVQEAINITVRYFPQLAEQNKFEDFLLRMYLKIEQYNNAAHLFKKHIEVTKNDGKKVEILWKLASCYIKSNNFQQAEYSFREILNLQPNNVGIKKDIALCLSKQGKYEAAKKDLNDIELSAELDKLQTKDESVQLDQIITDQLEDITSTQFTAIVKKTEFSKFSSKLETEIKVEEILKRAKKMASFNNYSLAIPEVRAALSLDPKNSEAKKLEEEFVELQREQSFENLRTQTNSRGIYYQAQKALQKPNLSKAEKLLREAIAQGDRFESAIKDLASVMERTDRREEAIDLLNSYRFRVNDKVALLNKLENLYTALGRYPEAKLTLEEILWQTPPTKKPNVLKRIASTQYSDGEYEQAEKTLERVLKQNPGDQIAINRLQDLREAKKTGIYTNLDHLFAQEKILDTQVKLEEFLAFHLERCDYSGLVASKIASKEFTEKDVESLKRSAEKGVGIKRPRERASYYLSAAKILIDDLKVKLEEIKPRVYLRNFCAAMGDACIAENKDNDVVRSYYAEAFRIAPEWTDQLEVKLLQYIKLYYSTAEDVLKTDRRNADVESCLEQALSRQNLRQTVIEDLLHLSLLNNDLDNFLGNKIYPNNHLREMVELHCWDILGEQVEKTKNQDDFARLWQRGKDVISYRNQDIGDELTFLKSVATRLDSLENSILRVKNVRQKFINNLDKNRLNNIADILNNMLNYSQNNSYNEQEYYHGKIRNRVTEFLEEVEDNPTKYSCELFRPYVISLEDTIKKHFHQVQQEAEPEELKTEFIISDYPHHGSKIECQVSVSNEEGKSTANSIKIKVKDSPTHEYTPQQEFITVSEYIEGGKSVPRSIPIVVSETAQKSRFTLYYELHYTTRTGRQIKKEYSEAISLYSVENFQEIDNPYIYGTPVTDENMFFGRDKFIKDLISSIHNSAGKKSFVFSGQKRTGKSSILYHLEQSLKPPIIPVNFSIQGSDVSSLPNFLNRIAFEIKEAFDDLAYERKYPPIPLELPTLEELQKSPDVRFPKYMSDLKKITREIDEYKEAKIILLIDEFSYIYGQIKRQYINENFMQYWKALSEKGYFGTVLVGQDYMQRFIDTFPNEFQVAEHKPVSYLEEEYARQLIVEPIHTKEGESRYKGKAVNRLIELTAGSPFYTGLTHGHYIQ